MRELSMLIKRIVLLPDGIEFYDVDGQIIFTISSASGGITDDLIIYLIKRGNAKQAYYKYGISLRAMIKQSVTDFVTKLRDLNNAKVLEFNPDGGSLGTGDNKKTTIEEVKKLDHPLE